MSNKPLSEIGKQQSLTKPFPALVTPNMGHLTLKMTFSIEEFIRRSTVFNRTTIEELNLAKDLEAQRRARETYGWSSSLFSGRVDDQGHLRDGVARRTRFPNDFQCQKRAAGKPVYSNPACGH